MALTLAQYLQRSQRLLDDFKLEHYNPYDLTEYINEARSQIASEAACIKAQGTLTTTPLTNTYLNSSVVLPAGSGYASAITVDRIWFVDANPGRNPILLQGRSWGWFNLYYITLGAIPPAIPVAWAQYQQGPGGSFVLGPTPNQAFSLVLDTSVLPAALAPATAATDIDALPYPWSDAVAYWASSLALRSDKQFEAADQMLSGYEVFMARSKMGVTPTPLPRNFLNRAPAAARAVSSGQHPPGPPS